MAGKAGKERESGEAAPLSCAPPLPSQKLLTHEGGGTSDGGSVRAGLRRRIGWQKGVSHRHRRQPDSWSRWLQRPDHLLRERSLPEGSSDLPWVARPHGRNS